MVQLLLHFGAGLHPDEGPSLLSTAARYGHLHLIRHLLPLDEMPDLTTALIEAAANSQVQVRTDFIRKLIFYCLSNFIKHYSKKIFYELVKKISKRL